jgi:uncharacterized RDD family membrane protein YckC
MRKGGDADPVTRAVGRRLVAWIIDCVVIAALVFALIAGVDAVLGPAIVLRTDAPALRDMLHYDTWILVLDAVLATTVSAVYGIVPWSTFGATPGQFMLGLRVVNQADRSFPTVFKSFQRWLLVFPPVGTIAAFLGDAPAPLAALVWAAAFTWFVLLLMTTALSETSQGLHDRLLGEVVQKS